MGSTPTLNPYDYSCVIVTTMKNEGPYILDWISHHLAIGFTHFVVLTNDCTDETEKILRKLKNEGLVTHKNNPAPHPRGPQKSGYLKMRQLDAVQNADWLMALDVDEYVRIDVGDGSLKALFEIIGPQISAVSLVWQLFGNSNVTEIIDLPVIEQFTMAAHPLQARPYEALAFKTLYKKQFFNRIGTHRPNHIDEDRLPEFEWIDGDGVSIKRFTEIRHWSSHANGLAFGTILGRINHYALRSTKSFSNKWARGFVHPNAPTVRGKGTAFDYWKLFNWNSGEETQIQKHASNSNDLKHQLLSINRVKHFHDQSVEGHQISAQNFARNHPDFFEKILEMGSSDMNDDLPDFSEHGCPPIGELHNVLVGNLNQ